MLVDALEKIRKIAMRKSTIIHELGLEKDGYFLMTMHREENLDYESEVRNIVKGVLNVVEEFGYPIVFPAHPRTIKRLKELGLYDVLDRDERIMLMPAVGYIDFIALLSNARLVLTDSGGVQQEACILKVPCVTIHWATNWIETLMAGANTLVGSDPGLMVKGVARMLRVNRDWPSSFGKPGVGRRIAEILVERLHEPVEEVYERYRMRGRLIKPYLALKRWEDLLEALRREAGKT